MLVEQIQSEAVHTAKQTFCLPGKLRLPKHSGVQHKVVANKVKKLAKQKKY